MYRKRNGKILVIIALVVAVAGLSLGYAALSTSLTINGAATVQNSKWEVKFANLVTGTPTGTAVASTAPTVNATTISAFLVTMKTPKDSISYTFDVINNGTYAAKIGTFTKANITTANCSGETATDNDKSNVCGKMTYTLKYASNDPVGPNATVAANDTLAAGQTRKMILTVTYDVNGVVTATTLPKNNVTVTMPQITMIYVQA